MRPVAARVQSPVNSRGSAPGGVLRGGSSAVEVVVGRAPCPLGSRCRAVARRAAHARADRLAEAGTWLAESIHSADRRVGGGGHRVGASAPTRRRTGLPRGGGGGREAHLPDLVVARRSAPATGRNRRYQLRYVLPSGHVGSAVTVYGGIALLIALERSAMVRRLLLVGAGSWPSPWVPPDVLRVSLPERRGRRRGAGRHLAHGRVPHGVVALACAPPRRDRQFDLVAGGALGAACTSVGESSSSSS